MFFQVEIVLNFFPGDHSTADKYKRFVQKLTKVTMMMMVVVEMMMMMMMVVIMTFRFADHCFLSRFLFLFDVLLFFDFNCSSGFSRAWPWLSYL